MRASLMTLVRAIGPITAVATALLTAPASAQNLHVAGKVGVGTTSPTISLHIASCTGQADCVASDASPAAGGYAMLGDLGSYNLALDSNEIVARFDGGASALYLNKDGGDVFLNSHAGTTQIGNGAGSSSGQAPLVIEGGSDINIEDPIGQGLVQVGDDDGIHLTIDNNEIMVRSAQNAGDTLYLNYYAGGLVKVGSIGYFSDLRLKSDIEPINDALGRLSALKGVSWRWKDAAEGNRSMGVIAQDVEKVFPEIVSVDPDSGLRSVEYNGLIGALIEGVKELETENDQLRAQLTELEARMKKLEEKDE